MESENYRANCRISGPILGSPDEQAVKFNGFAWSNSRGLIHETDTTINADQNNKDWTQWLGTQA